MRQPSPRRRTVPVRASGKVTKAFCRAYTRVPSGRPSPWPPYQNDIGALVVHGDRLWVFTSTSDEAKGTLVDVFDLEGRYLNRLRPFSV
jgi:hypothetical protein